MLARGIFPRILRLCFNIFGNLKIASLSLLALSFPTQQAPIFDPVFPEELEANTSLCCICWHLQQPHPYHYQPNKKTSQPYVALNAEKARSWSLLHHHTSRVISTPMKYADNTVLLLLHPKVKPRYSWLVFSSTTGHFVPHRFESWKPGNSFVIESVSHTKSHCLFLSSNLKQSEELTLVNGFHIEHPPATQAACSIWEQKHSYRCPERKVS